MTTKPWHESELSDELVAQVAQKTTTGPAARFRQLLKSDEEFAVAWDRDVDQSEINYDPELFDFTPYTVSRMFDAEPEDKFAPRELWFVLAGETEPSDGSNPEGIWYEYDRLAYKFERMHRRKDD